MTVEEAIAYLEARDYAISEDNRPHNGLPWVSLYRGDTEMCLDGDFEAKELLALSVLLAEYNKEEEIELT